MTPTNRWLAAFLCIPASICAAQGSSSGFPDRIVIAQDSFIDIGPPFHFYELIRVDAVKDGVSIERVLLTPEGQSCLQPAKIESRSITLHETIPELLQGKNPCLIPEKELRRELKRRKKGLVFSGANVTMLASCGNHDRVIRMDILDRDMFDSQTATPEHTSWTMKVLATIDEASGPGGMDTPIFSTGEATGSAKAPESEMVSELRQGKNNSLFGSNADIPEVVVEADEPPPPPPSVELLSSTPQAPVCAELPKYPPIARLARLEGAVNVTFDIDASGKAAHLTFAGDAKNVRMLESAVENAIAQWIFPKSAYGHAGQASFQFKLNCQPHVHTTDY
jgi:TonB family protein